MAYDAEFKDGFDKYGPIGHVNADTLMVTGEWTLQAGLGNGISGASQVLVASLVGVKTALKMTSGWNGLTGVSYFQKAFGVNYARAIGGMWVQDDQAGGTTANAYVYFVDSGAAAQVSITCNNDGTVSVRRGDPQTGTVLGTTSVVRTAGSNHHIGWDITFHGSAGIAKIYVDGVLSSINLSSQNTAPSGNANFATVRLGVGAYNSSSTIIATFDDFFLWLYTAAGGGDATPLTSPIIETQVATADSAVQFTPGAGVLGPAYRVVTTTDAPGANQLVLRKYTAGVACTLNSVAIVPGATSAGAKFKGVIYSDVAGVPTTLLSSGTEVVGATSGSTLTLPLVTPQSLSASTDYWIGYITDTSVLVQRNDATTLGSKAANTYGSGAPGTAPAMTSGQASWLIWGNVSGMTVNWAEVALNPPLGDLSYISDSTVGHEDLYSFPVLVSTPSVIYSVSVKAYIEKTDAGTRTVDLRLKSGGTTSSGATAGQAATLTYQFVGSNFVTDPATGVAFTPSGLNAATAGLKIAS